MVALMARNRKDGMILPVDIRERLSDLLLLAQLQERRIECSDTPDDVELYFQLGVELTYVESIEV